MKTTTKTTSPCQTAAASLSTSTTLRWMTNSIFHHHLRLLPLPLIEKVSLRRVILNLFKFSLILSLGFSSFYYKKGFNVFKRSMRFIATPSTERLSVNMCTRVVSTRDPVDSTAECVLKTLTSPTFSSSSSSSSMIYHRHYHHHHRRLLLFLFLLLLHRSRRRHRCCCLHDLLLEIITNARSKKEMLEKYVEVRGYEL